MVLGIRAGRSLAVMTALLWLGGCALPASRRGPGELAGEGESEEIGPAPGAPVEGGTDAQADALRARLATSSREDAAAVRFQLARTLESSGRDEAALVEYLWITGAAGRPGESAAAWDGIARLSRRAGDEAGAARAEIAALEASEPGERARRETALRGTLAKLDVPTARHVAAQTRSADAGAIVREEIDARAAASEIVIALLLPLSGRFESFGKAFQLGAELALRQRNAATPSARRVRLAVEDAQGDLLGATAAARRALFEESATCVIGPLLSVPALGAGALAEALGVPLIAPTATDPDLRRVGPHVLTLEPSAQELTEPLAHVAVDVLGGRRFGALVAREATAEDREREFRAALERRGAEISLSVAYDPGERDFRKYLDLLREATVDAVYVPGDASELEALVPQLEFYDFDRRILGHGGWTSSRVLQPGLRSLEGALLTVEAADDPGSPFAKKLQETVQSLENAEPTRFHIRGAQVLETVLFALDHGATDPEALALSLSHRSAWAERPAGEEIHLLTIRGGALVPTTPESLAAAMREEAMPPDAGEPTPGGG